MKPLLPIVVTILVLTTNARAHPKNIAEEKQLPQTKEPLVEAEESDIQVRVERCTTCTAGVKLNIKSPNDVLAALQQLPPGSETHTQQSFESCTSDKGCAGLKVKDGRVIERFGSADAFKNAAAQNTGNEFTFHAAGSLGNLLDGNLNGEGGPFWWNNQNSPFKNAAAGGGNFEKFSKSSSSSFSTTGNAGAVDIGANPFLNGDFSKLNFNGGAGFTSEGKPNYQSSSFESSSFSTSSKGDVDLANNPFLNGAVGKFGQTGFQAQGNFGAGAGAGQTGFGQSNFNQASFGSSSKFGASGNGYAGSTSAPFSGSTGSNVNLIQNSQKEIDFESQQTQQSIDEAFQHTGNVNAHEHSGGDLQQTCAGQGYVCVPKAQCNNGVVNTNGASLLQANTQKQYCNTRTEICCRIETSSLAGAGSLQGSLGVGSATFTASGSQGGLFSTGSQAGFGQTGQGNFNAQGQNFNGQSSSFNGQANGQSSSFNGQANGQSSSFNGQGSSSFNGQANGQSSFNGQANGQSAFNGQASGFGQSSQNAGSFNKATTTGFGQSTFNAGAGFGSTAAPSTNKFGSNFNNEVFKQTSQSNFIETDSFTAGSDAIYRPGASGSGLKPGIPYLPPVDSSTSASNVVSSTAFVTTPRPRPTTVRPFTKPFVPSTAAPGYLPPIGESTNTKETRIPSPPTYTEGEIILDESRQPTRKPTFTPGPSLNEIPAGCAAALKCTPIEFCTAEGVMSKTPVVLTKEQDAYRVPLTDCKDIESGRVGKCCRDPDYTDPWPTNQLGKWVPGVFGGNDGRYVPDSRVSPTTNVRPQVVTSRPPVAPVTGSVYLNNFRTTKPTVGPILGPNQLTPGFPTSTPGSFIQKGQFDVKGQGSYNTGGQGQFGTAGLGQTTQGGQFGQGSQFTQTTSSAFGQTTKGQGQFVNQGQGQSVSQGVGQTVSQGQGSYTQGGRGAYDNLGQAGQNQYTQTQAVLQGQGQTVSQGQGGGVIRGSGQTVSQGSGQTVSQGIGQTVTQGQGQGVIRGSGQTVTSGQSFQSQGQGQSISQGAGIGINRGQGQIVSQGQGFGVTKGQGQIVTQGQGASVSRGQGQSVSGGIGVSQGAGQRVQGSGFGVSQGQGVGISQGSGQTVSQGFGQTVTQGFGVKGQGQAVNQGAGFGISQGSGQSVSQGAGFGVTQGAGQTGQGSFGIQGSGQGVSQGIGFGVSQGSGQTVSQGAGFGISQGAGQGVSQGFGVTQGAGQSVSQGTGFGITQGQGQTVSQGAGFGINTGQGQFGVQGQGFGSRLEGGVGFGLNPGIGFGVIRGEGQTLVQGQGQKLTQGVGSGEIRGEGFQVSQGGGFGLEKDYGESVQRVFLKQYSGNGQCGLLSPQKPYGNRNDLEVDFSEIPWQAMVLLQTNRSLLCGGVITRPDVVVTNAACVEGLDAKNVLIKGGEWKLGIDDEPLPFQIVQVKTILRHPFYKHGSLKYDAAILVLAEDLRFDNNIQPICLPGADQTLDAFYNGAGECIVTGWGKIVLQAHLKGSIMHGLNVSLINPGECEAKLQSDYPHLLDDYEQDSCVCGQPTNPLNNICKVDIGSGLACTTGDGRYVLRGIYSWDSGCQVGNQLAGFYKFDLEWYQWAIGLIESVKFTKTITGTKTITTNRYTQQLSGVKGVGTKGGQGLSGTGISGISGIGIKGSQISGGQYTSGISGSGISGISGSGIGIKGAQLTQGLGQGVSQGFGQGLNQGAGQLGFGSSKYTESSGGVKGLSLGTQLKGPLTNTFSATYTEKKVFQSEPKYVTYTTKPEIVTFTTKPEYFTYTTKPKLVTYTTKPEIVTFTTKPEIVTYTTKPEIVTYTTKPKLVTYTTKPQIIRYETSGSGTNPQYVSPGVTFNPSFSNVVGHKHSSSCKCLEGK